MHITKTKHNYTELNACYNNIPIEHVAFIIIDGGNRKYHVKINVVSYISPQNGIVLTNFISDINQHFHTFNSINSYFAFIVTVLIVILPLSHSINSYFAFIVTVNFIGGTNYPVKKFNQIGGFYIQIYVLLQTPIFCA